MQKFEGKRLPVNSDDATVPAADETTGKGKGKTKAVVHTPERQVWLICSCAFG